MPPVQDLRALTENIRVLNTVLPSLLEHLYNLSTRAEMQENPDLDLLVIGGPHVTQQLETLAQTLAQLKQRFAAAARQTDPVIAFVNSQIAGERRSQELNALAQAIDTAQTPQEREALIQKLQRLRGKHSQSIK
ncbi:hypothetical protein C4580_04120 [Candidatus Woesearchaeota archaeon]|nr:MAG: hypothetical protein C4580_04120 [Candidatus Woesearchaeota archaeon]